MNSMSGSRGAAGASLQGNAAGQKQKMQKEIIPKGYRKAQINQFTPEQMQLYQQLFGEVSPDSQTSRLANGDEELFDEMEAPAFRQFNELQGQLASRFSGAGMGARKGSGFKNQSSAAASNFAQDLASRRQELQRNAIKDLHGMSTELLGIRPQEKALVQKEQKRPSFWEQAGVAAIGGVGTAAKAYMGGGF
jgi:hypothetical protein